MYNYDENFLILKTITTKIKFIVDVYRDIRKWLTADANHISIYRRVSHSTEINNNVV